MLNEELTRFVRERKFARKGPLCVALVVTQHARQLGLPPLNKSSGKQALWFGMGFATQQTASIHR